MVDLDRIRIARRIGRGQPVEPDWGLVITPPSQPGARGGGGSYRWTFYDPPVGDDGKRGRRVQRAARQLDDMAWQRIEADLHALEATMLAQVTGNRLDATFDQLARHWLDPARHPNWSNDYAKKVQSVTTTWLLAVEALSHVRLQRSHGTYRSAHECLTAILAWGTSIKWLPTGRIDTTDIKRAPDPRVGARRKGARGNISPVPKDDIPDLTAVLLPFHRWVEHNHGRVGRILLDLLAFAGPRIGEVLADSRAPVVLYETGHVPRHHLPATDVRRELLVESEKVTHCPYKGSATYYHVCAGHREEPDVAWSYPSPFAEALPIAGLICFPAERVHVTIDEVLHEASA